jgi:hypothetical protein
VAGTYLFAKIDSMKHIIGLIWYLCAMAINGSATILSR